MPAALEVGSPVDLDATPHRYVPGSDAGASLDDHPATRRGIEHERGVALEVGPVWAMLRDGGDRLSVDVGSSVEARVWSVEEKPAVMVTVSFA